MPLGINGDERHAKTASLYPTTSGTAPGYRDFGRTGYEGVVWGIGNSGYSWTSAANGIRGMFLSFDATGLNPSDSHYRANGLQLRCLSE